MNFAVYFLFSAYLLLDSRNKIIRKENCRRQALAEMLRQNQTIRWIDLRSNQITKVAAKVL